MNQAVNLFLIDGCGRCKLYKTPQCKVHTWIEELNMLRSIVLESELVEELKWSFPVYTYNNKNVIMLATFKDYCALSFFKGALLKDPHQLLSKQGESSQSGRLFRVTKSTDISTLEPFIKAFIAEAIEIEKLGLKVEVKKNPEPIPVELLEQFKHDKKFEKAFFALTPGKQRAYIIHFSQPKQSKTRESRIENCIQKILNGEGFNDKYSGKK